MKMLHKFEVSGQNELCREQFKKRMWEEEVYVWTHFEEVKQVQLYMSENKEAIFLWA